MLESKPLARAIAVAFGMLTAGAQAGTLAVFGDQNMWAGPVLNNNVGNQQVLDNLIGDPTGVLISNRVTPWGANVASIDSFLGTQSVIESTLALAPGGFNSSLLSGYGLLIIDFGAGSSETAFSSGVPYTSSEVNAIRQFLISGGNVAVIGETTTDPSDDPAAAAKVALINGFLADLGSDIDLGSRVLNNYGLATGVDILDTALTAAGTIDDDGDGLIDGFFLGGAHQLSGGIAAVQGTTTSEGGPFTVVAFSNITAVPLPAALPLFLAALAGAGFLSARRRI